MPSLLINTEITLNLLRPNSNVVVYAKQYDTGSRTIDVNLVAGTETWDPPAGIEMLVMYSKPDGTVGVYDTIEDGSTPAISKTGTGTVKVTLAEQALTCAGNVIVQLCFISADKRSSTLSFIVSVEKGYPADNEIESNSYFSILQTLIENLLEATVHPPIIDPNTKYWMLWDSSRSAYIISEYSSVGTITVDTDISYQVSASGTVIPTGEWQYTIPQVTQGQFLWTKTILTFGDGTEDTSYQTAYHGLDGIISVNQTVEYAISDIGTTPPSGGWSSTIPTVPPGYYLWSRITLYFNDGSTTVAYQVSRNGLDGSGATSTVNGVSPDPNGNVVTMLSVAISSVSSLPFTLLNSAITDKHVVLEFSLTNPAAQVDDWELETTSGGLTITGTISGETDIQLVLGASGASVS